MAIEMLVRSSQDTGSSVIINELLSVGQGATQYRLLLPESYESTVGALYKQLKDRHNATLIGSAYTGDSGDDGLKLRHGTGGKLYNFIVTKFRETGMTVEAHVARDTYAAWGGAVAAEMLEGSPHVPADHLLDGAGHEPLDPRGPLGSG